MNLKYNPKDKVELHFEVVGSGRKLSISIDKNMLIVDVLKKLYEAELIKAEYYTLFSLRNQRTGSFLANENDTLQNSNVINGDTIRVFPPLGLSGGNYGNCKT